MYSLLSQCAYHCLQVTCYLCPCDVQGFKPLMSAHRVQDLARMYSLLSRVGGTDALQDEWRQYITTTGTAIVKDEANVSTGSVQCTAGLCRSQSAQGHQIHADPSCHADYAAYLRSALYV
jgi:hypothetical protein